MPQIDEPTTPAPKAAPVTRKPKSAAAEKPAGGVFSFTIDTAQGRVVTVESVDGDGVRHPLTPEQKAELAKAPRAMPLRRLVEHAFEAGIDYVLGEHAAADTPESKEEGEFSGMLLQKMIEGSKAGDLIKGDALDRTVIDTLITHAAK
ncbi:MAG TPA: hypothetical protein VH392_06285 [Sphingomicrobium sp.]|jgi:hypothetical protein